VTGNADYTSGTNTMAMSGTARDPRRARTTSCSIPEAGVLHGELMSGLQRFGDERPAPDVPPTSVFHVEFYTRVGNAVPDALCRLLRAHRRLHSFGPGKPYRDLLRSAWRNRAARPARLEHTRVRHPRDRQRRVSAVGDSERRRRLTSPAARSQSQAALQRDDPASQFLTTTVPLARRMHLLKPGAARGKLRRVADITRRSFTMAECRFSDEC